MELRKERISSELSQKIVRLLAHPSLTDLPENPVGAVWSALLPSLAGFEEVELPETVALADVAEVVGEARMKEIQYRQHHLDAGRVLRSDTSMPMLIDTARSPRPCRRIAKGKVYRDETEDHRHLQAFHQAEILVVEPDADEWAMAAWLSDRARELFGDRKLMMKQIDFHFMCQRAFELHVEVDGEWLEVAGFGRFFDDIAERLGGPGARAVGAGLGLERWAQLAYGIDDIRKVENARVPEG